MSNLKKIITLYGAKAIAEHLGVSVSSVNKYKTRGYLKDIAKINRLAEKDVNFSADDFIQDYKNDGVE